MELSGSLCSEFIYICPVCVTPYGFPHGLGDPEMPTRCVLVRPYFPTSLRMTVATGRRGREVTVSTTILPLQTHIFSNFSLLLQHTLMGLLGLPQQSITEWVVGSTIGIHCLRTVEARSPRPSSRAGWFLLRAVREGFVPHPSLWLIDDWFHIIFPPGVSICAQISPHFVRTPIILD